MEWVWFGIILGIIGAIGKVIDTNKKREEIEKEAEEIRRKRNNTEKEAEIWPSKHLSETKKNKENKVVNFSGMVKEGEEIKRKNLSVKENKGVVQTVIILEERKSDAEFNNKINSALLNLQKDNHEIIDISISHISFSDRYNMRANSYVACITYRMIERTY